MRILLLYDTMEKDLARDFQELLEEFGLEVSMIPRSPDLGKTLQDKEQHYFSGVDGAVFLVTPGATRGGAGVPSPSVADEMGQARQVFEKNPERLMYLVDADCRVQAVDQRTYIQFRRSEVRSILEAVTVLLRNLKAAGLVEMGKAQNRQTPALDISKVFDRTRPQVLEACLELSSMVNGACKYDDFFTRLTQAQRLSTQDANFVTRDLLNGPATLVKNAFGAQFILLTPIGWELVKLHRSRASANFIKELLDPPTAQSPLDFLLGARKPPSGS